MNVIIIYCNEYTSICQTFVVINKIRKLLFFLYNTLHIKNKDYMDKIKNLGYNQIKIFINLEIIGEEKLYIYIYIFF